MLPLRVKEWRDGREMDRAVLLMDTLARQAAPDLWDTLWVVVPPDEVASIGAGLQGRWDLPVEVVSELDWLPELRRYGTVRGWHLQQLVKLAAARVAQGFYLTLDADVVCRAPLRASDLLRDGRAPLQAGRRRRHPGWWRSSARVLGVPPHLDARGMGVTPAVLAAPAVAGLLHRLEPGGRRTWVDRLAAPLRKYAWQRLAPGYRRRWGWTEYSLYHLHLESTGQIDRWHFHHDRLGRPFRMYSAASVWSPVDETPEALARRIGDPDDPSLFIVFQSNASLDPDRIRAAVELASVRPPPPAASPPGAPCG